MTDDKFPDAGKMVRADHIADASKMVSPTCFRCNHANMRHTGLTDHTNAAPGRPERRLYQYQCKVKNCGFVGWYHITPTEQVTVQVKEPT